MNFSMYFQLTTLYLIVLSYNKPVSCLKCYQCSSLTDRGCYKYNLKQNHLKNCENNTKSHQAPVCRSLMQINYFTLEQDLVVIRECAYIYKQPLGCEQSKFSNIHYSLVCECNEDGCNKGSNLSEEPKLLLLMFLYKMMT
ncbi:uncharacterized protein LOC114245632 [Bombyx mandarina]|uniref:Protein sleepless n=2 Tax=Bombyx TaxID=7090 RepID=A0A8R2APB2_BOMMO|nr:uncharacterized protein LOC101741310 [Bombyx mori]XP_028033679.1 uncharacterized protein LOC114245632 [Bombyx mandarina]